MSRFVSAGRIDATTGLAVTPGGGVVGSEGEEAADVGAGTAAATDSAKTVVGGKRQGEWEAVRKELDEQRRRREEDARKSAEGGEKSLFAILQENKAAKQAEFEEKNKIKNQFRPLDDDEIEFLDEVQASARREEERRRREVEDGLDRFREAQRRREREGASGAGAAASVADTNEAAALTVADDAAEAGDEEESWAVGPGKKRRRKEKDDGRGILKGLVRRKTEDGADVNRTESTAEKVESRKETVLAEVTAATKATPAPAPKLLLGLVDYGSDEDSE